MTYYKKISYLLLAGCCWLAVVNLDAKPITREQARQKTKVFQMQRGDKKKIKDVVDGARLAPRRSTAQKAIPIEPYYVFERGCGEGFYIASGDDQTIDILGYTDNGTFDYKLLPLGLQDLLNDYARQIEAIQTGAPVLKMPALHPTVEKLMTSKWNQGSPYNNLCPQDEGKNSVTGCVATAMAQILYYHRDKSVTETQAPMPGYTTITKGIQVAGIPAESPIDWGNMKDSYESATDLQQTAVAQLMLYCGVSVQMDYTKNASGATSDAVVHAMQNYFGYSTDSYLWNYTNDTEADQIIYTEMEAGRPVYVSGTNATMGHAFVCDGYENRRFHINWGWGGQSDGLYYLSNLTPGNGQGVGGSDDGYNGWKNFLINMKPKTDLNMPIRFADTEVRNICLKKWDANNDGMLTYGEAAEVTDLGNAFEGNIAIKNFPELYNFTSLTTLSDDTFNSCTSLTTIRLPKSLKQIGKRAFKNCVSICQLNLPTGVDTIGEEAFCGCTMLSALELPIELSAIEQGTFKNCAQISDIELPLNVTYIGDEAFSGCLHLKSFTVSTFRPSHITMGIRVFNGSSTFEATLNVMQGTKSFFSQTSPWSEFGTIFEMRERSGGLFADLKVNETYYILNVGTGQYLTKGEANKMQAIVGTEPMRFKILHTSNMPEDIYLLTSTDTDDHGTYLFRTTTDSIVGSSVKAVFVNGNSPSPASSYWTIKAIDDKLYTIQVPENDAIHTESGYLGVQPNQICNSASPTYGVYFDVNYADHKLNCQWMLVRYDEEQDENYKEAEMLAKLIDIAKKELIPYNDEEAVYNNFQSTTELLKTAQSSLRKKLGFIEFTDNAVRDKCIQFFDSDANEELSYKEAAELTDLGKLFAFAYYNEIESFDELRYFTNISFLEGNMFYECRNLKSVILPKNLEKIYDQVFYNCKNLLTISIPERVNTIGDKCFYGCSSLSEVAIENPYPITIDPKNDIFSGVNLSNCTLYVPFGSKDAYAQSPVWKDFGTIIEVRSSRVTPQFSPIDIDEAGYIYNIGSRRMISMGEAYGTQSVVSNNGCLYQWKRADGNYYLYDVKTGSVMFRTKTDSKVGKGVKACFGDGNLSAKAYWKVESVGECIYTLQVPQTDEDYTEGEYLGIDENHKSEFTVGNFTYGLYWDIAGMTPNSQWSFVTESDMRNATQDENVIAQLKDLLAKAKSEGLDINNELAVYNNPESTMDDLRAALITLREKMHLITFSDPIVETTCLANWDTNLDGNLSFEEAQAVISIGETFHGINEMSYFEELKYFTSLTELPDNAFKQASALKILYLPESVKKIGNNAFTDCSLLRNLVIMNRTDFIDYGNCGLNSNTTVFVPENILAAYNADETWTKETARVTEFTGKPVVTAEATRQYGRVDATVKTVVLGAPVDGDPEIVCDFTKDATTPVGTYPIEVTKGSIVTSNVELREGVFTVTPAPLTITAISYNRAYGEVNPEFKVAYRGFRNKETAKVLTKQPVITCDATPESPAGEYEICVSDAEAQNYDITYVSGILTITGSNGVSNIQAQREDDITLYDLQGRRVRTPKRGLYIKRGRKTLYIKQNQM